MGNLTQIPGLIWNMSLGTGLINNSSTVVKEWANSTGFVPHPDFWAQLLAGIYSFMDIAVVALFVAITALILFRRQPQVAVRNAVIGGAISAVIWGFLFNPFDEMAKASNSFATFFAFMGEPWSAEGIILTILGIILILIFMWKYNSLIIKFFVYGFFLIAITFILTFAIDPGMVDPGVALGLMLINFAFVYKLISLIVHATGLPRRTEGTEISKWMVVTRSIAFSLSFIWISVMYPDRSLFGIPLNLILLGGIVVLLLLLMVAEGRKRKSFAL